MMGVRGGIRASLSWIRLRALVAFVMASLAYACAQGEVLDDAPPGDQSGDDAGSTSSSGDGRDASTTLPGKDAGQDAKPDRVDAGPSDVAAAPTLTSISPNQGTVGSTGPTIVVTGTGFVARTVVQLNGAALPTSFVSSTELRATIPTGSLAAVQTLHVTVGTSPPGGGASAELPFDVVNPSPSLTALAPTSAPIGSPDTALTVTGAQFVSGARVRFAGVDLATSFGTESTLTATIPSARLTTSGSFDVTVVNPAPGGGTSTAIAFTVTNPTVTVASVSPQSAIVGAAATPIALVGTGFVAASAVSFNGATIASSTTDGQHITATVPASALTNAGDFSVVVTNPAPGGGVSTPVSFHVVHPAPTATSLSPSSVVVGTAPPTITVVGTGFLAGKTKIAFDGAAVTATTVIDATHVSAALTTAQVAAAATIAVTVVNPAPGGGTSAPALTFTVNNPSPGATSLAPSSIGVGAADTTVTITGSGFVQGSTATSNGASLATTYVSGTKLTAVIPSAQLTSARTLSIAVTSPAPGGGTSTALSFTVTNPGPTLTSIAPSFVALAAPATTITITGADFIDPKGIAANGSIVMNGTTALATSFVSATQLTAVLPAAQLTAAATLSITVVNPAPGGGTSSVAFFAVNNPAPVLTSVTPGSLYFGAATTTLTLTGSGFVAGSVVKSNGAALASTTQSASSITATLPASQLAVVGPLAITVTNAAPGGGTSAAQTIGVACNTQGSDYALDAAADATLITLNLKDAAAPHATRIGKSTTATMTCPYTGDTTTSAPYRAYVVQNTLGRTATLSAWAVCTSDANHDDDAFLAFYNRSTVPTTQAELTQCTGVISEGSGGGGGFDSNDPGGSSYCPGLTKTNGKSLSVPACGKAVVVIQAYNATSTAYPPPASMKIKLE
jgi:hypothetical protein